MKGFIEVFIFFVFSISLSSKLAATFLTIAPIIYLRYLFKKGTKFKNYNVGVKSLISLEERGI